MYSFIVLLVLQLVNGVVIKRQENLTHIEWDAIQFKSVRNGQRPDSDYWSAPASFDMVAALASNHVYNANPPSRLDCNDWWLVASRNSDPDNIAIYSGPNDWIMIAFEGSHSVDNWLTDANFNSADFTINGQYVGVVHQGFLQQWWKNRDWVVQHIPNTAVNLLFTGHSLGAAVAALAATDFKLSRSMFNIHAVTFGQPRGGNYQTQQTITNSLVVARYYTTHYRNLFDVVTLMSPRQDFVQTLANKMVIEVDQQTLDNPPPVRRDCDFFCQIGQSIQDFANSFGQFLYQLGWSEAEYLIGSKLHSTNYYVSGTRNNAGWTCPPAQKAPPPPPSPPSSSSDQGYECSQASGNQRYTAPKGSTYFEGSAWKCMKDVNTEAYTPVRLIQSQGNVACMSYDSTGCIWATWDNCNQLACTADKTTPYMECGERHRQLYGVTGYCIDGHWCRVGNDLFGARKSGYC